MKTKTIDLKGKQYAQVKDRLQEFRKDNPRGLIKTTPEFMPDGQVHFTAYILKDKAEETSADATGHSYGPNKGEKQFEKLETIAVGRALALLGYASDGEIASSEEMEEFETYQKQKREEMLFNSREKLEECQSIEELKTVWAALPIEAKQELEQVKEARKTRLTLAVPPKKSVKPKPQTDTAAEQPTNV